MANTVDNPLLGDLTQTPGSLSPGLSGNAGVGQPNQLLGGQPNPPNTVPGLQPPVGNPPPQQGNIPGASGAVNPFSQLPNDPATLAPNPGSSTSTLTWLEELAIRIMIVTVGLVLIMGGFKIAASRGILSGTGLQQIAGRVGLPIGRATR
jgi:hypothetical protein